MDPSRAGIPLFYDFEASGLTSFPIKIGWAWLDGSGKAGRKSASPFQVKYQRHNGRIA
jgi:hypothetical protein